MQVLNRPKDWNYKVLKSGIIARVINSRQHKCSKLEYKMFLKIF